MPTATSKDELRGYRSIHFPILEAFYGCDARTTQKRNPKNDENFESRRLMVAADTTPLNLRKLPSEVNRCAGV